MRILILGGCGFIGSNLYPKLLLQGYEVAIYDKVKPFYMENKVEFYRGTLEETDKLRAVIKENDIILHLISTSVPNSSNKNIYSDAKNNILDTLKMLELCIENKVKKIIYPSSGGNIYGIPMYTPIDESHPTEPTSAYGIHKLAIEKYLGLITRLHGIQTVCLRISNPYGPGQKPFTGQGVIATYLASALLDRPIEVWGDGLAERDYLHIDDLIAAFTKAIEYEGSQKVLNIGSGEGTSVNNIIDIIENITGKKLSIIRKGESTVEVKKNILDYKKAEDSMGWSPLVKLEGGILTMLKSWDNHSNQFLLPYDRDLSTINQRME